MPQFTGPISIQDGAAAAVSYSPEQLSSTSTVLVDRREATRELQPSLTISFDRPTNTRQTYRIRHSAAIPIKQTVNGIDVVAGVARANVEYIIPANASNTVRKNLRALLANAEDAASLKAGIEDLDPLY